MFNTDQSGFNIESLSGRTLNVAGVKQINSSISQSKSQTHSHSIQVTISQSGKLFPRLFIVLQESSTEFGPIVREHLFRHPEIDAKCHPSGKVVKELYRYWNSEHYFPHAGQNSLLVLDSYSAYRDRSQIDQDKPRNAKCTISTIPPGLTGECQPLDVAFFRSYKSFHRRISDFINNDRPDIKLHLRNSFLKLQSCVYFQFRSPRFEQFNQHAWLKAGLMDEDMFDRSVRFPDPVNFGFNVPFSTNCSIANCQNKYFIRCSWCAEYFCFDHFYIQADVNFFKFHYCNNFVQS